MSSKIAQIILLSFIVLLSANSASAQNLPDQNIDKVTYKRLKILDEYKASLQKNYSEKTDQNVRNAYSKTLELSEGGITLGLDCLTKLDAKEKAACAEEVKIIHQKVQAGYRLTKYYAILAGKPTTCVKADLGGQPHLKAKGISKIQEKDLDNPKETGRTAENRLFFCGGNNNKKGSIQIKWRVQDANGKFVRVTDEDKTRLGLSEDINGLPTEVYVQKALETIGLK